MFDIIVKFAKSVKKNQADIIIFIGVLLVALLCFSLGYIAAKNEAKPKIYFEEAETN